MWSVLWVPVVLALAPDEASRSASAILRELDRLSFPSMSRGSSNEAARAFKEEVEQVATAKSTLAKELFDHYPDHPRSVELMAGRWALLVNSLGRVEDVLSELEPYLDDDDPALRRAAFLARARASLVGEDIPYDTRRSHVMAAVEVAPEDAASGVHLMELVRLYTPTDSEKRDLCERVLRQWPDEPYAASPARGYLKQLERIGDRCEIAFDDVIGAGVVDDRRLRGKPVLVMIWSGFWSETDAEMARIRALREKMDGRFEVVGIHNSRHQRGLDGLRDALREHDVEWPVWYWAGEEEFTAPWEGRFGSSATPLYLVLDDRGVVRSVGYRVRTVERKLLALMSI